MNEPEQCKHILRFPNGKVTCQHHLFYAGRKYPPALHLGIACGHCYPLPRRHQETATVNP